MSVTLLARRRRGEAAATDVKLALKGVSAEGSNSDDIHHPG